MKLRYTPLLSENKQSIIENVRQAKQYIKSGKLSQSDFKKLVDIDPSPTRKYVGWMAKQWITKQVADMDKLASSIEEFDNFVEKNATKTKDIYQFKKYKDFENELEDLNLSGAGLSKRDLESDYEVIVDDDDFLIVVPHTHEASRKLGLTDFAYKYCEEDKIMKSNWCTTYRTPVHFDKYYYDNNITLYYIKVRSEEIKNKLKKEYPDNWAAMMIVAISLVNPPDDEPDLEDLAHSNRLVGSDGDNNDMRRNEVIRYLKILDIK